jgi:4-hydroxy-tetrahydrodipicolinate synthase
MSLPPKREVNRMPKTDWFSGVFPALVTPFDKNEEIKDEAFLQLIDHVLPHVNGIVPCGTTGEFSYLSEKEKRHVLDLAVDGVKGKVPVIAGTGCPDTKHTMELTQYAKDIGCKAALIVTPFYLKPSYKEIYEHYDRLNSLDFPIILYNIPQCTGVHKKWWTAEGLAQLENVIGIKDSSGDMPFLMALFEKVKDKISIFCGHDEMGMPALAAGCDGLILASANLIPDIWQRIFKAVSEGDLEEARKLQAEIQKLVRIVVRNGASQAAKEGLQMMGLDVGNSRRPIMPGGPFRREDREELRIQLENLGKIPKTEIEFKVDESVIKSQYPAVPYTPSRITDFTMKVGEGFAGPPFHEVAHIDLLIGTKKGPVGVALENALVRQEKEEGEPLRIIYNSPKTLLVPTVTVRTKKQAAHLYDHAAKGVILAIDKCINDGILPREILDDINMIANVFVHPAAANRHRIMFNNYKAMLHATKKAIEERPSIEELINEKESARHPFKYTP